MNSSRAKTVLSLFENLAVWRRGSDRAPHKPLTILMALGLFSQGIRLVEFANNEERLTELLREFGPASKSYHPEYPFWRLQNDAVWVVEADREMAARISNSGDIPRTELRAANAAGHFSSDIEAAFAAEPRLVSEVAQLLLTAHFPESLHEDILDAVGLQLHFSSQTSRRRKRDPNFRKAVLGAYQYRCALCGLDLRIGNVTIGLEAAHIKWHQAQGPDEISNGLALCSLHHKLFDLGAFTLDYEYQVLVSEQVHGTGQLEHMLLRHHERRLKVPAGTEQQPFAEYVNWHRLEVFKTPARLSSSEGCS